MVQRQNKGRERVRGRKGKKGSRQGSGGGISVVTIDPGSSTGLAWACVPLSVLREGGSWAAVEWAVASMRKRGVDGGHFHAQTFVAADYVGRGSLSRSDDPLGENAMVQDIMVWLRKYSNQAGRVTQGRVLAHSAVVIEDFLLRRESATARRDLLSPVRIQSKLEYQLWMTAARSGLAQVQQPSQKSVATDARLKKHGLWKGFDRHQRDAIRHMIVYLRGVEV